MSSHLLYTVLYQTSERICVLIRRWHVLIWVKLLGKISCDGMLVNVGFILGV